MTKKDAGQRLADVRGLWVRLFGDRVVHDVAGEFADQLGWSDTSNAEYVALTQLQADARITLGTPGRPVRSTGWSERTVVP